MKFASFSIGCALVLTACETVDPTVPEVVFLNTTPASVQDTLVTDCLAEGWVVHHNAANMVTCGYAKQHSDSVFTKMRRFYFGQDEVRVQYGIAPTTDGVRVRTHVWLQRTAQYGQTNFPISDAETLNDIRSRLLRLSGKAPQGRVASASGTRRLERAEE